MELVFLARVMPPTRLVLALAGAALLTGCPGAIDDPQRFRNGAGHCPDDFDVEADLFRATCAELGCHTGGPSLAAAGLDLGAPGVGPRLLAHRSRECGGRSLIDPYHLGDSYLVEKVDEDVPSCGDRMPSGLAPLNGIERVCLTEYLTALAASATADGAVPPVLDGATPAGDAGTPAPVTIEAEAMSLTGYEPDAVNAGVIRIPDLATTGTASATFEGIAATYRMTIHVWAEADGQSTLTVRAGGVQIADETYPLASADLEPVALGPYELQLAPGDVIELEGQVGGAAWARVDRLEIAP